MLISKILPEITQNRQSLTKALLSFVQTDTILFAFNEECRQKFTPFVAKANIILNSTFTITKTLDIPTANQKQNGKLLPYFEQLSCQKFATLYLTATETRSVLLSILFTENVININTLLQTAFFEELYQQNLWGKTDETEKKYTLIKEKLTEIEHLNHVSDSSKN